MDGRDDGDGRRRGADPALLFLPFMLYSLTAAVLGAIFITCWFAGVGIISLSIAGTWLVVGLWLFVPFLRRPHPSMVIHPGEKSDGGGDDRVPA